MQGVRPFALCSETNGAGCRTKVLHRQPENQPALADGDMGKLARRMYNVFEDVLTRREGEIAAIKSRLLDGGALGAVMSGTGSAVFGIFADADSAAYAKRRLARDYAECFLTETIDRLEV